MRAGMCCKIYNVIQGGIMSALIVMIVLLFCGCEDDSNRVSPPDRMPDMVTDSGVFIYLEDATINETMLVAVSNADYGQDSIALFASEVEKVWKDVQDCLGLYSDDPPFFILTSEDLQDWGDARGVEIESKTGYAFYDENLILINDQAIPPWKTLRHEFIHIVLHQNGVSSYMNSDHEPEYMWACQYDDAY